MYISAWEEARKIRLLAGDQGDIDIDMDAGLEVPNPYYNDWLDDLYGALPFRNSYKRIFHFLSPTMSNWTRQSQCL